jgi:V8-like Glu-specific endopeptidase
MRDVLAWRQMVRGLLSLMALGVVVAGCASPSVDDPFGTREVIDIIGSTDPPTGEVRVGDHITVEWIGTGTLVDDEPDEPLAVDFDPSAIGDGDIEPPLDEAEYEQMAFHVFNPETGNEFLLVFEQPVLDAVHAFQAAAGLTDGTATVDDPDAFESAPVPQGWSGGTDDRIVRTATTLYPWRTIAQHGSTDSGCTSTLIGPRHLITAAHCINRVGTNDWFTVRVDPGRNGLDDSPFGSSTISTTPPPGTSAWYFTPASWRTQWCADNYGPCRQFDWGMIVIPDRLGDVTGWMGYWAGPYSYLSGRTHFNRGYPKCDTENAARPSLCAVDEDDERPYWARFFGDVSSCSLGDLLYPGPDGWNRTIRHSCDTSGGQSGSPVYHYRQRASGEWVPVVSMVHGNASCHTCSASDTHPNLARRITPGDLGIISWLRNAFP